MSRDFTDQQISNAKAALRHYNEKAAAFREWLRSISDPNRLGGVFCYADEKTLGQLLKLCFDADWSVDETCDMLRRLFPEVSTVADSENRATVFRRTF